MKTDLWTVHNYTQDPEELRRILTPDPEKGVWRNMPDQEPEYEGQPYIVDEFGGIKWVAGAGALRPQLVGIRPGPKTLEEFYQRLEGLVRAVWWSNRIWSAFATRSSPTSSKRKTASTATTDPSSLIWTGSPAVFGWSESEWERPRAVERTLRGRCRGFGRWQTLGELRGC